MDEKKSLNNEELKEVVGGRSSELPVQHFFVGDKVLLRIYPEYGVGIVRQAKMLSGGWQYVVQFDAGMMTADDFEFIPA